MPDTLTAYTQRAAIPDQRAIDRCDGVVIVMATRQLPASMPYYHRLAGSFTAGGRGTETHLPNKRGSRVNLFHVPADTKPFDLLTRARLWLRPYATSTRALNLALVLTGYREEDAARLAEAWLAAVLAHTAQLPDCKQRSDPPPRFSRLYVYGLRRRLPLDAIYAEAEGNALARALALLPGNRLQPSDYVRFVRRLAAKTGWAMEFYNESRLRRMGAGAFLAVCQGSPANSGAGLLRLSYQPPRARRERIALVGKGVCFDTGGVNLKPSKYMYGMHKDMQGSAVALGVLLALTRLRVDYPVDCWLALAVNDTGPRAYRPNDVVTAANGLNIEIVDTDAEGRMLLADTLYFASRRPGTRLLIDYATLTGTCGYAIGDGYSGVFSNRSELLAQLVEMGHQSGERVWPFPIPDDYGQELTRGCIADLRQCAMDGKADHIYAACFLRRFLASDVPWVHMDLSAATHKGGLAHIPTDVTGFGVRLTLHWLNQLN